MTIIILIQAVAGLLEITGVMYMATLYVNVSSLWEKVEILSSSLVEGQTANDVAEGHDFNVETKEKILKSMRGLALIGLGFIIQTCCLIASIFMQ